MSSDGLALPPAGESGLCDTRISGANPLASEETHMITDVYLTGQNGRPVQLARVKRGGWTKARRKRFLDVLATTCNVTTATAAAGMKGKSAYDLRKRDPAFAALWQEALAQGYETLEQAVLRGVLEGVNAIEIEGEAALAEDGGPDAARRQTMTASPGTPRRVRRIPRAGRYGAVAIRAVAAELLSRRGGRRRPAWACPAAHDGGRDRCVAAQEARRAGAAIGGGGRARRQAREARMSEDGKPPVPKELAAAQGLPRPVAGAAAGLCADELNAAGACWRIPASSRRTTIGGYG